MFVFVLVHCINILCSNIHVHVRVKKKVCYAYVLLYHCMKLPNFEYIWSFIHEQLGVLHICKGIL